MADAPIRRGSDRWGDFDFRPDGRVLPFSEVHEVLLERLTSCKPMLSW